MSDDPTPSLFDIALSDLDRYRLFPEGWDGYRGAVFTQDIVDRAKSLVYLLETAFSLKGIFPSEVEPGPCPDGRVDLDVRYGNRRVVFTLDTYGCEASTFEQQGPNVSHCSQMHFSAAILWLTKLTPQMVSL